MHPLLEDLQRSLESSVEGMSAEQLHWHPQDKWCAAEILEHLYLSYTGTTKGFQRMLDSGKPPRARGSIPQLTRALLVFGFNHLPSGRQSPAPTRPKGLPFENVRGGFAEKLAAMDAIIAEGEARFGGSARLLEHPFLGPLTGAQWRKFHQLHGMHHRKQIVRLRETMEQNSAPPVA
jgi:DinB superfamily